MRLVTVISLLLLACTACTLQLHHEERRDGFRLSVFPRRSFQPNPRKRLASRRIESSMGPDIAPRGNPMNPRSPSYILSELKRLKESCRTTPISSEGEVQVYRFRFLLSFKGQVVVKEISFSKHKMWDEKAVKMEVRGARNANALYAVLEEGETYFILMRNLGDRWDQNHHPEGHAAFIVMNEADKWYEDVYFVKRNIISTPDDYAWTLLPNNTWKARMAGQWRHVTLTEPRSPIPKARRYRGIKEWDKDGLPIFSMDNTDTEYYTG